jgi:hypothetical protein
MNEEMRNAWVEITRSLGEPTLEELDLFLRTWQMAIQAEREECAHKAGIALLGADRGLANRVDKAIRTRGQP